ncbi:MAG: DNA-directed RNA polymerase subunit D [Candidatus Aenigmarchaeota archaeon]|nr:DNA-directed RNA polymerase subunit D [Candidatus Aenigmarchaeota archaeon]NIP40662.1 DNA-directed RNA polymerase subunit D [Candidatus Aenigmarchaeota archaeon]NIQ18468.1 DNA-directed RNA polymerase subunit D [Candidatus Aenigmarchaeota archaeon]NIS73367.1 DNA-directed RNA polymerase subunit D [Candidatus Aenigmarchaeota archaeon]
MKIKIISKKGDTWRFLLDGATPALANALRRIMMSEVPTLAIEWVDFHDNTSSMFDEVVAHRLGMIPLIFDLKKFNFTEDCKCKGKGCPLCQVVFSAEKPGPSIVYSGDMKSSNRSVKPVNPDFPIVKLLKGQNLKFEAIANMGKGKDHAKWQAANVSYQYLPQLEVKDPKDLKKIVKSCPQGVMGVKNRKLVLIDPFKCDECRICEEMSGKGVEIKSDPNKFVFKVESISGLDPKQIILEAAQILEEKANEFKSELKNIK